VQCPRSTYIAWVQHSGVFPANLGKHVALVAQQPVHVPYEAEVLLVPRSLTYCLPPFFYQLEDSGERARPTTHHRRSFGEAADELVKEFLCANLEVEGVSAVLNTDVEELSQSKPGIAVRGGWSVR
jgi:hypothetical protein